MNPLFKIFEQSTDAVFGIDNAGMVRFANNTFERMTGIFREDVHKMPCYSVLNGTDIHGCNACSADCQMINRAVDNQSPVNDFDRIIKRVNGQSIVVSVGVCLIPQQLQEQVEQVSILFSLRRIEPLRVLRQMAAIPDEGRLMESSSFQARLTQREMEILSLAVKGMRTHQIASKLCISTQTIRSHFKNIYKKIGVHSRSEAILFAVQRGLAYQSGI